MEHLLKELLLQDIKEKQAKGSTSRTLTAKEERDKRLFGILPENKLQPGIGWTRQKNDSGRFKSDKSPNSNKCHAQSKISSNNSEKNGKCQSSGGKNIFTDDGFKIVNSISSDDSDISDAFESDVAEDDSDVKQTKKVTDDGFKIVASIPSDDSDISDAFESDISDNDSDLKQTTKVTDDGFKIVDSIPSDDSDISDAFESDISDEEFDELDESKISSKIVAAKNKLNQSAHKKSDSILVNKKQVIDGMKVSSKNKTNIKNESNVSNKNSAESAISDNQNSNEGKSKKRKRGSGKNKKSQQDPCQLTNEMTNKKNKKKKPKLMNDDDEKMTPEELERFKARYPEKAHKFVKSFENIGLSWEKLETKKQREERLLARLPQPEQRTDCKVYLKFDANKKVIKMLDFSKRPKDTSLKQITQKQSNVPKEKTKLSEEEALKLRQQAKKGNREAILKAKDELTAFVYKTYDPKSRTELALKKIERLGGGKVKNPYVNYKVLMEQKKIEKAQLEVEKEHLKNTGMHDMLKKKKKRFQPKKRDSNDVGGSTNQAAGKFKDGVLVLNKRMMEMAKQWSNS